MYASGDRRARRSHRSRSRSPASSRSRRSSHRRSSKRRSPSRSRSRERSRRSSHSRRHRSRSRSRSRERYKRRRRNSDDKKERRRSRSKSKSRSISKAKEKKQNGQVEISSKELKVETVNKDKKEVKESQDVPMEEVSEPQEVEVKPAEESKEEETVEKAKQTNNVVSVESFDKQAPKTDKTAVDVSSIKADILKALADARSTIAGIKKNGANTSVPTTPKPDPVPAAITTDKEEEEPQETLEVQEKHEEVVESPKEQLPMESSPKKQLEVKESPKKLEIENGNTSDKTSVSPKKAVAITDEFDMFSMAALDDHDDAMNGSSGVAAITVNEVSLQSNCDDAEGYYSTTIGEVLNGKYRVLGAVGKGVFSTVLRCQCITPLKTSNGSLDMVAVKLIRNNDVMRDAAQTELKLLNELGERDSRDKKHCIRLLDSFTHRNHVAMVFEPMQMNVREAMKKFGGKGGISIQAVRVFSKHLLIALNHLETCEVIHADIKPDNMLLDEKQTTIKLCDFGSAFKAGDGKQDPTPYLVSRFYRAPEIVLGLAYDKAVDMWSVGCCLYEMFTGKVMFPGSTNNEMLKFFMELKGKIPNKLIKSHRQAYIDQFEMEPHFTEDLKFCSRESDRVTGKPILRLMDNIKTKSDLASSLMAAKSPTDDRKQVLELRSLLDRMFTLDPSKRISVKEALAHPFPQMGRQTLDSLYPQARKLQFELKMQMSYLDSGRTGGRTDAELQGEARSNLSTLEQLLWQLDSLVQTSSKPAERDTWTKKLQQLRSETHALGSTLEQHIYSVNRRAVEARERESLMSRRNGGFDSGNGAMYAAQESESLQRSSQMVSDLTSLSQSILGDLGEQRNRMKNVRTKLLDIANRLGLSSSLLRVIERRDTVDFWIVIGGMIFTLLFLYICYSYTTQ
ncbi:Serine/threonine-protein kinase PRP4 [Phytophthora citrophthora]|uniref:non-specific serine/threonine protein kinase n=1 Tax=Phytophthora citrophthora TaxID=4793 RepID=A0AAD9LMH8_9STRA|nr:Serine/threonine-protein kinase PRP4 [Phytophthora citrophthora]